LGSSEEIHMRVPRNSISRRALGVALLSGTLLAGCTAAVAPDHALSVTTDRERYDRAGPGQLASVGFTARNVGKEALYVGRCGPAVAAYVDRHEAGEWVEYLRAAVVCPAAFEMSPIVLAPAESVTPAPLPLGPGVYRLRVPFAASSETGYDRIAVSNPFVVE
jgi:hypothetical protein